MGNALESFLARLTGRASWPSVHATVASHLLVRSDTSLIPTVPEDETTDIFRYEVDGTEYIRPIHEVVGDTPLATGDRVLIQYNPKRPSQCYYAPNNQLSSRALVATVVLATVAVITYFVVAHR